VQLGDTQLQRAEARVEAALAAAVAVIEPVGRALMPATIKPSTSASIRICSTASATGRRKSPSPLLQQVNERHSVVGHRVLGQLVVKPRNSTLAALLGDHLSLTRAPGSKFWGIPPDLRLPPKFHHQRGR
jgi:hypothetical protein